MAEYIYEYGHVPSNLKAETYDNADNMFPVEDGVTYQQCSLIQMESRRSFLPRMESVCIIPRMMGNHLKRFIKE